MSRFDYVKYDALSAAAQQVFKALFSQISDHVQEQLADGRAKALVFTKLEEAYMWVGKAIRDDQIWRTGEAPLQEERNAE